MLRAPARAPGFNIGMRLQPALELSWFVWPFKYVGKFKRASGVMILNGRIHFFVFHGAKTIRKSSWKNNVNGSESPNKKKRIKKKFKLETLVMTDDYAKKCHQTFRVAPYNSNFNNKCPGTISIWWRWSCDASKTATTLCCQITIIVMLTSLTVQWQNIRYDCYNL